MNRYRTVITRTVVAACLVFLMARGAGKILPHQLGNPPLFYTGYDLSYWIFRLLHIDALLISGATGPLVFTLLLFSSLLLLFCFPQNRLLAFASALLYLLYSVSFHLVLGHTLHYNAGFVILLFSFCAGKDQFWLWWEAMRYFACFALFTAFLWKIVYGSFFQWDAGVLSMRQNLASYLLHYPDTATAHVYYFMLQHPAVPNLGHKLVLLAEAVFVAGFFTKRYDRLLILSLVFILISIYLFADVFFAELAVLVLPFIKAGTWETLLRQVKKKERKKDSPKIF